MKCILCLTTLLTAMNVAPAVRAAVKPKRLPNILWITCEDIGPHLGCYGDTYAETPNLDRLAARRPALPQRLVERPGLCAGADHDHHRRVSHRAPARAHAEPWCAMPAVHEDVSATACASAATTARTTARRTTTSTSPARCGTTRRARPTGRTARPGSRSSRSSTIVDQPREPDPHPAAHAQARPGQGPRAGLSSRHARGAPRLGPVLRQHHRDGRAGRQTARRSWTTPA